MSCHLDRVSPVFICTLIEASLTVVCACLPTLRPIFIQGFRQLGSGDKDNKDSSGSSALKGSGVRANRHPNHPDYEMMRNSHQDTDDQSFMASVTKNPVDTSACRADRHPFKTGDAERDGIVVHSEIHTYESRV